MTDVAKIAASLTKAQRRFVLAASSRRKAVATIRRHAKLSPTASLNHIWRYHLFDYDRPFSGRRFGLNELGQQVRHHLERNPE